MLKVHDYIQLCSNPYGKRDKFRYQTTSFVHRLRQILLTNDDLRQTIRASLPKNDYYLIRLRRNGFVLYFFPFHYDYYFTLDGFIIIEID